MVSKAPGIVSFSTSFRSELPAQSKLETLKVGTLRLLDRVGVHSPSRRALDLIANVGPRSRFLRQKHTRKHIRDLHLPSLQREDAPGHPLAAAERDAEQAG